MKKQEYQQVTDQNYFRFQKVDDYFADCSSWQTITRMESYTWDEDARTLTLNLVKEDGDICAMLIQIATGSSFRVRFHPDKKECDYQEGNTRTVVLDTFKEVQEKNRTNSFHADVREIITTGKAVELSFHGTLENQELKIRVMQNPFSIQAVKQVYGVNPYEVEIMSTPAEGLRYHYSGGFNDYHIIQTVNKPCTAKYIGFGEQGGLELVKNNTRITYFNYDNMRYRQVYNHGPFEEREPLYHSDPFFIEINGVPDKDMAYGIFVDNPSETLLDMGYYHSTRYQFGIRYGDLDYYVIAGNAPADIIKSFSNIIGTARLIPRYALGYHQGCYGYECRHDIEEVVDNYRKYQIPLDGIHIDVDIQKNYKTFTIDTEKFPNPKNMFDALREKGVKCSTNITPIISNRDADSYSTYQEGVQNGYFVIDRRFDPDNPEGRKYYKYASGELYTYDFNDKENRYNSGQPFVGEVYYGNQGSVELGTTGHYPDLNRKEVRIWWGKQYQYLFDMGLEMVWQDMTTPCLRDSRGDMLSFPGRLLLHNDFVKNAEKEYEDVPVMKIWNLYSYNLHKATYHGLNQLPGRENKRNFIIGRGCFTGMQRFAGLWTGDNSSNWDFLKINISQVLALGLTGQALSGQDIGGFEREQDWEEWADPELLIRWTAMGAFLPWFRNHYIRKGKKLFQEPYAYQFHMDNVPEETKLFYRSVLPVCKYYIELRYTLLQLFYDGMFENTLNGMPICRALFLTNPEDKALFNDKADFLYSEFMVGNDFLVAPVVEKQAYENGCGKRDIYLPTGNSWYQFNNFKSPLNALVAGGTTISDYDASISADEYHIPYIVPIYVKEGAIIPTVELEQYVGERNANGMPNTITLHVYPGFQGSYTMYLDDGVSRSSQPEGNKEYGTDPQAKGEYRETRITHCYKSSHRRQIVIERIHDGYTPEYEKYFLLAILHEPSEDENPIEKILLNDTRILYMEHADKEQLSKEDENAFYYDRATHTTYVKVFDYSSVIRMEVIYKGGDEMLFNGGDGSDEHPYEINNAEQLDNLSRLVKEQPKLYAGASYKVTSDIQTDKFFCPIGSEGNPFTGKFDGGIYDDKGSLTGKHTITLNWQDREELINEIGIFGVIGNDSENNACIKNLKIDGKVFASGEQNIGGIAGILMLGTIEGITVSDSMIVQLEAGRGCVGAVAGKNYAGTIQNCISYGEIRGCDYTGGIVGYNSGIIKKCCNAGVVIGKQAAGGIVGTSYTRTYGMTSIECCLHAGVVKGAGNTGSYGGIASSNLSLAICNCSIGETPMGNNMFGSCQGGSNNNYYFAVASYDSNAINKDREAFESGEVTRLLQESCECFVQGTIEGGTFNHWDLKSYPVIEDLQ